MITVSKDSKPIVRETVAPWQFMENGAIKTENIRVLYHDLTTMQLKAQQNAVKSEAAGDWLWNTDSLLGRIHSLPDFS